jgi:hypothetical protein
MGETNRPFLIARAFVHGSLIPNPFSHRLAQRDGESAALTRLATEASAVILMQNVEEADRARRSQDGRICRRRSQFMRKGG